MMFRRAGLFGMCAWLLLAANHATAQEPQPKPIQIKVVVVAMFERGEDTGDVPGEYQLWVEREHLDQILPMPAGYHHLRMSKDGVLGLLTGAGTAKAAASVMALGLDPRFDLSKAYWLVAGNWGGGAFPSSLGFPGFGGRVVGWGLSGENYARRNSQKWENSHVS